jgi:hypothetical protein
MFALSPLTPSTLRFGRAIFAMPRLTLVLGTHMRNAQGGMENPAMAAGEWTRWHHKTCASA